MYKTRFVHDWTLGVAGVKREYMEEYLALRPFFTLFPSVNYLEYDLQIRGGRGEECHNQDVNIEWYVELHFLCENSWKGKLFYKSENQS